MVALFCEVVDARGIDAALLVWMRANPALPVAARAIVDSTPIANGVTMSHVRPGISHVNGVASHVGNAVCGAVAVDASDARETPATLSFESVALVVMAVT